MQKIFEEYGGVIVTVIAIVALIGIVGLLMEGGTNGGGWIGDAFKGVIDKFLTKAGSAITA